MASVGQWSTARTGYPVLDSLGFCSHSCMCAWQLASLASTKMGVDLTRDWADSSPHVCGSVGCGMVVPAGMERKKNSQAMIIQHT